MLFGIASIVYANIIKHLKVLMDSRGFCVNGMDGYKWFCDRTGASWSNPYFDGFSDYATKQSFGRPSFKSNASLADSMMSHTWTAGGITSGNPLTLKNTYLTYKWGNPSYGTGTKWPDIWQPTEKGGNYEGE